MLALTPAYPQGNSVEQISQLDKLKKKGLELFNELKIANEKVISLEEANEIQEKIISNLEAMIELKEKELLEYQKNLDLAEGIIASKKERHSMDSIMFEKELLFKDTEIASKNNNITSLRKTLKKYEENWKKDLDKAVRLIFLETFKVVAVQNDPLLFGEGRPNTKIALDEKNSNEVKSKLIEEMYIEFKTGNLDYTFPDYSFTLVFSKNNGEKIVLFNQTNLETINGDLNHKINFEESNDKTFEPKKGKYELTVFYERNQEKKEDKIRFTLD